MAMSREGIEESIGYVRLSAETRDWLKGQAEAMGIANVRAAAVLLEEAHARGDTLELRPGRMVVVKRGRGGTRAS